MEKLCHPASTTKTTVRGVAGGETRSSHVALLVAYWVTPKHAKGGHCLLRTLLLRWDRPRAGFYREEMLAVGIEEEPQVCVSSVVTAGVDFAMGVVMHHQPNPALQAAFTAGLLTVAEATSNGAPKKSFGGFNTPHQRCGLPRSPGTLRGCDHSQLHCQSYHGMGNTVPSNALWETFQENVP